MVRRLPPSGALPGKPAGAVYGTIVTAGQLAIEAGTDHNTPQMVAGLASVLVVFWLAHGYADSLGTLITDGSGHPPSLRRALREEWPIVESGLLPILALLVGAAAGARPAAAAVAALVLSALELIGWSVLAARRAGRTGLELVVASLAAAVIGAGLIGLKYLLH